MIRAALALAFAIEAFAQSEVPKNLQIFLLIGQSNMAGRGAVEPKDKEPIPRVFALNEKKEWVPAVDPLHVDKPAVAGVGIGRSFARALLEEKGASPDLAVGLVPAAFGGSALDEWAPGGKHYANAVERARAAMKSGRLRGILWHQGEADSKAGLAETYRERFAKFISKLREDLGAPDAPVVVGQLGPFFQPESEYVGTVNEQLALIPLAVPKAAFVSSQGLKHKGDNVHFDSASLRELGRRYALAYRSLVAPPPPVPEEVRAWSAAMAISDPEKKIAAIEKFKAAYPAHYFAGNADEEILSTLLKKLPEQKARIRAKAKAMYGAAEADAKGRAAASIAEAMLEARTLLKDAEQWAKRSLESPTEAAYMASARAAAEKRKQKLPSDEESRKRYRELRAGRLATLGRIYLESGRTDRAQTTLEEAWAANPKLVPAAAALGEIAAKAGRDEQALDYLITARLGGKAPPESLKTFEAVYRRLHGGSIDGVDAMLDSEYRKRYVNPVHDEPYRAGPKRTDRVVLAEVFTGAGCPPCVGADLAFDVVLERYTRQDVAVLMYHQHIPRPDPMANRDSRDRASRDYEVRGVPTYFFDGSAVTGGGGPRENAPEIYKRVDGEIRKALETAPLAKLSAAGSLKDGVASVHASADSIQGKAALKLRIALVEKELRYSGENGIRFHPMVVRAFQSHEVKPSGGSFDSTFDLKGIAGTNLADLEQYEKTGRSEPFRFAEKKHEMSPAGLAAVVFLEDPGARRVLQARWVDFER